MEKVREQEDMDTTWIENYERKERLAKEKATACIPYWIEKGQELIFPERYEEWEKCVRIRANDLYHGEELDTALEIMTILEEGAPIETAIRVLNSNNNSGAGATIIRSIVYSFSSRGPEFWERTATEEINLEEKRRIEAKKEENKQLSRKNSPCYTKTRR